MSRQEIELGETPDGRRMVSIMLRVFYGPPPERKSQLSIGVGDDQVHLELESGKNYRVIVQEEQSWGDDVPSTGFGIGYLGDIAGPGCDPGTP